MCVRIVHTKEGMNMNLMVVVCPLSKVLDASGALASTVASRHEDDRRCSSNVSDAQQKIGFLGSQSSRLVWIFSFLVGLYIREKAISNDPAE